MAGNFFQIDRGVWTEVVELGLNAAIAYLVLACGTGRNNHITSWSVNAIENYTGMSRGRAKTAIERLIERGAIAKIKDGSSPQYLLPSFSDLPHIGMKSNNDSQSRDQNWIWIPNSIVTGVGEEVPPLAKIRSLQEIKTLRLLVAFYEFHELAENGGVHWRIIRQEYKRTRITERGIWNIWGFDVVHTKVFPHDGIYGIFYPVAEGFFGVKKRIDKTLIKKATDEFWNSWNHLRNAGLVQIVPHLVEADTDEANVLFPAPRKYDDGEEIEKRLGDAAQKAAQRLLADMRSRPMQKHSFLIPIPDGYPNVTMVGIGRLRYRPHTKMTAAWGAKLAGLDEWIDRFDRLGYAESWPASARKVATSKIIK